MKPVSVETLVAHIPDNSKLAIAKDDIGVAMAATRALARRGVRGLHLVCLPVSGLQADLLIAAGCVSTVETSAVTLGEYGGAPHFARALRDGSIRIVDGTCPAIYAGMQASQKGIPFMPLRGILDSDLMAHRDDWTVIDNPFSPGADPIVAIRAIDPDLALFHAQSADESGNVFVGRNRDGMLLAHAARSCLVTVERIEPGNLLDDPSRAGAVVPALYIDAIAHCPNGAWPIRFGDEYRSDDATLRAYLDAAGRNAAVEDLLDLLDAAAPDTRQAALQEAIAAQL